MAEVTPEPAPHQVDREDSTGLLGGVRVHASSGMVLPGPKDAAAMDMHLVGGILWTAAAKWSTQLFTWASVIVVTRFVAPSEFGLLAMAGLYLGVPKIVSQFGFGSAVITLHELTDGEIKQINSFAGLFAILAFVLSCALAEPIGLFFHSPRLPLIVVAMSTTMLAAGFQTIPSALLQRDLRFKALSLTQAVTAFLQTLCTLTLALLGFGVWALVAGYIVGSALLTAATVYLRPRGFAWPRLSSIRHAVAFSWQVLIGQLSWYFYSNADFLVAGRVLGANILGSYDLAWYLATLPVEKVTTLVGQVTPAVFSAKQADHAELTRYVLTLTEGISVITFPMGVGLALTAPILVPSVFGTTWTAAIVPLQILALFACTRSVGALIGPLLTSLRDARFVMWTNLAAAVVMPSAFYIGSRWGAAGIATGWILAYPFILISLYIRAFSRVGIPPRAYLRSLGPAINGVLAMSVVVLVVQWVAPRYVSPPACLALEVVSGAFAYVVSIAMLHGSRVRSLVAWYRRLRAGMSSS